MSPNHPTGRSSARLVRCRRSSTHARRPARYDQLSLPRPHLRLAQEVVDRGPDVVDGLPVPAQRVPDLGGDEVLRRPRNPLRQFSQTGPDGFQPCGRLGFASNPARRRRRPGAGLGGIRSTLRQKQPVENRQILCPQPISPIAAIVTFRREQCCRAIYLSDR